ncbi:MAG: SDR family NAD(P)-dependent oxidoreductase [Acidimicrobiia bacterium]
MHHDLEGLSAIVTGASQGLGREIAGALAERGAQVVLAARRRELLETAVDEIESNGGRAIAVPADLADTAGIRLLIDAATSAYGTVDILVNNAADEGPVRR